MKAQDTKRAFEPNFPNFPAIRPKANFFEPRQIWHQNAPNSTYISNIIGFLGKHPACVTRNCASPDSPEIARFFCKQTRIGIIPTRKADPNIFLIAPKQDYIDAQYVKVPYSMWPFPIFDVLLRKRRQNGIFRKTSVLDEKLGFPLIVRKSLNFFVSKPKSALFLPKRPTLIFFWLPRNRITLTLNMLNFPILWPSSIFDVLLRKRRQNVLKLNNFKGVSVTRHDADHISWPFVKRDFDMLRILNLPIRA